MTNAVIQKPMQALYARLGDVGIKRNFAKKVLPEWWTDEIALTPSGRQQAEMYFSAGFNIDLKSFSSQNESLKFSSINCKYKLTKSVNESDVATSANYVSALAKLAMQGLVKSDVQVPQDALELRTEILKTAQFVDLDSLLSWCYQAGIPVLFIDKLPGRKMAGLVVRNKDRYAIVLSKKGTASHLLFCLAHELGHIAHGHLSEDGFVADTAIDGKTDGGDADEKEADAFAIRLLNGKSVAYSATGNVRSGKALYQAAHVKSGQERIDVGHIILNYGFNQKAHAMAALAMRHVPNSNNGVERVNLLFWERVGNLLSKDKQELLKVAMA